MKVFLKGKNQEVNLTKTDYISAGGQAEIFGKGNVAYKVYFDQAKYLPEAKIKELSTLTDPNIIKPEDILIDSKNNIVGYSMKLVKETNVLSQIFPRSFKERYGITPQKSFDIVIKLQRLIEHIHSKNILAVDCNELNWLLSKDFNSLYAIDTDSYQTKSFPATFLMDSIKDYHSNKFSPLTDWFAFCILSIQIMLGIHPFKGKYKSSLSMSDRMIKNISIFNKDVSLPHVCYPFDVIPQNYRDYFKSVLEDGNRLIPPKEINEIIQLVTKITQITGNNSFDIKELNTFTNRIVDIICNNGLNITITTSNIHVNKDTILSPANNIKIGITPKTNSVIISYIENHQLILYNLNKRKELLFSLNANEIMEYENRIYCKNNSNIVEIIFTEIGINIIASSKVVGTCLDQATHFYDGVVIQNLLGAYYVSIFPKSGINYQIPIKELNQYKIIDAKYINNVLMVVGVKNGKYDKFIIRFSSEYDSYDLRIIEDIVHLGFNFTVLDNGVCVNVPEEEKLEIFSNKKDSSTLKIIDDKIIQSDMKLFKNGTTVLFARDNKIYLMRMK